MRSVHWNIAVSPEMDQSVRRYLATQAEGRAADLSHFIEEAVQAYLFERAVEQAKAATAHLNADEIADLIDEAVQ